MTTAKGLVGGRFGEGNRLGILASASFHDTDRGSDNYEPEYDDGFLEELQLRDYTINRERTGFTFDFDARASDASEYFVRGIWNEFSDQEFRRRLRHRVGDERNEREPSGRKSQQLASEHTLVERNTRRARVGRGCVPCQKRPLTSSSE